jgi:hypothetical protein
MSDTETKQIVGVCEEISEKNGWTAFAINVGSTYPVRLSTKLPALIEQGRAVGQQQAVWTFKESQGGENPNKPGTYYTNRYFDGVTTDMEAHDSVAANNTPSRNAPAAQTHAPLPAGDKDRAITRMAVLKAAAEVCASIDFAPGEDVAAETIAMAARFETWVYRDTTDIPFG